MPDVPTVQQDGGLAILRPDEDLACALSQAAHLDDIQNRDISQFSAEPTLTDARGHMQKRPVLEALDKRKLGGEAQKKA